MREDPEAIQKALGASILRQRLARGWSQEALAERIDVSMSYVGLLERGERVPALPTLLALAQVFDTSVDALLGGTEADAWLNEATEMLKGVPASSRLTVMAMLRGVLANAAPSSPVYRKSRQTAVAIHEHRPAARKKS